MLLPVAPGLWEDRTAPHAVPWGELRLLSAVSVLPSVFTSGYLCPFDLCFLRVYAQESDCWVMW